MSLRQIWNGERRHGGAGVIPDGQRDVDAAFHGERGAHLEADGLDLGETGGDVLGAGLAGGGDALDQRRAFLGG